MDCGDPSFNMTFLNQQYKSGTGLTLQEYPNSVALICIRGFIFTDLSDSNVMTCTERGTWSFVTNCIRMLIFDKCSIGLMFSSIFSIIFNNEKHSQIQRHHGIR